ncbi:hypothetical protein HW555_003730 [Spodoptera exigua]|uniref:Arrestin C-terminal-like domain-containing protein n=1 Tax=Spodoptera exigua TaxID=7107 RepID=A0A835GNF4_SPOEX|nr:hypothetical protein HW555_003730 [Spodoptera exigua]
MGFDEGQIILDSENGAYYAGQTVYGRLVFSQDKVKTIHGIYVDMKGFCKVHWTTSHSRRVNNRTQHYTVSHDAHEEYFRSKRFLIGSENAEHHLQPGNHEFRFDCPIPINCPSSFEGSHGHIRYRIKVVMVTKGMFSFNKDKMVPIKVHAPLDLNMNPYCREPMEFDLSTSYCCWCVSAGHSEIFVKMPVGGYVPGQIIPMEVSCKNESNVEIEEIKFAIKKDVQYIAESAPGTRNEHDTVAELKKGPIPGRTTRNWTVEMEMPTMDIYNVAACRFINIDYKFKVSTEVSGCHDGTEDVRPIIFGTVPIQGFQDNVQNPLQDQLPQVNIQNVQNTYPPPPIMNQPLPNSPYANGAPNVYPNNSPYPGAPGYPTTPVMGGRTSPYPGNQPSVTPYPPNQPYPGASPYPSGPTPYPGGPSPYPGGPSPYPSNTPYSTDNSPYGGNQGPAPPYPGVPGAAPPYPGVPNTSPPYPNVTTTTLVKTGNMGFTADNVGDPAAIPLLPQGANVPYPTSPPSNPYATASAPVPSTPGTDEKKPPLAVPEDSAAIPPYNPEFMKENEKKDEKVEKPN